MLQSLSAVIATLSAGAGVFCLHSAWYRSGAQPLLAWTGWGLVGAAGWGWSLASGLEYGIVIASVIAMLWALLLIAARGDWPQAVPARRAGREERRGEASVRPGLRGRLFRGILRFLAVAVLPAASAIASALLYFSASGMNESSRLVAAAFFALAVWTLATVWCCADKKMLRPSAALAAMICGSGLLLAVA